MVKININIQKKDLWLISAVFVFFIGVGIVAAVWDVNKKMFHAGEDVKVSIGGVDYSLQEAITAGLIGGGGGSGVWKHSGALIYSGEPADANVWYSTSSSSVVGGKRALVMLKVFGYGSTVYFRPSGENSFPFPKNWETPNGAGANAVNLATTGTGSGLGNAGIVIVETDAAGEIQVMIGASKYPIEVYVLGYISS